jgi:hypothetical protein
MAQAQQITILDAYRRVQITGKLVKTYPLGLTIDDDGDVRHYATFDRVITPLQQQPTQPGNNGDLW